MRVTADAAYDTVAVYETAGRGRPIRRSAWTRSIVTGRLGGPAPPIRFPVAPPERHGDWL